jgi:hypothetical protein
MPTGMLVGRGNSCCRQGLTKQGGVVMDEHAISLDERGESRADLPTLPVGFGKDERTASDQATVPGDALEPGQGPPRRRWRRLWSVGGAAVVLALVVVAGLLACGGTAGPRSPTEAPAIATARALMRDEIVQDFVGLYTCRGSRLYGASLSVTPNLRYAWQDQWADVGCFCSGEEGQVIVEPERLLLMPEVEWDTCEKNPPREDITPLPEIVRGASDKLIPVKWGQCRLLVPEAQLTNFCQFLAEDKIECGCFVDFSDEACLCYGRVGGVTHEGRPMLPDGTPICP